MVQARDTVGKVVQTPFTSFRQLIETWPTIVDFAREVGVGYEAAKKMRDRDSIDDAHWDNVVVAAKARRIRGVTVEMLARISIERKKERKRGTQVEPNWAA